MILLSNVNTDLIAFSDIILSKYITNTHLFNLEENGKLKKISVKV